MKPLIQAYPPLGQVTPLESGCADLTAVLEIPGAQETAAHAWEVSAWCSIDGSSWTESPLHLVADAVAKPQRLQPQGDPQVECYYYTGSLTCEKTIRFTLKYRHGPADEWRWTSGEQGISDGTMVVQATQPPSEELEHIFNLDPEWEVSSCMSQTPKTLLWSLEASASEEPSDGNTSDSSTFRDIRIGGPREPFQRWFALVRHSSAWLAPRHGKETLSLDKDSILCAFLTHDGRCLLFLALGGVGDVLSVLRSTPEGHLSVHARCDKNSPVDNKATILVAESADLGRAIASVMYHAREIAQKYHNHTIDLGKVRDALPGDMSLQQDIWYDGLGYCTWNSLGQRPTEDKMLQALDDLSRNKIDISTLIMDDNWQSIDYHGSSQFEHGWLDFEAEPQSFPQGLKSTVAKIRKNHPNIRHVAVWHALLGYWGGISETGALAQKYKTVKLSRHSTTPPVDGTMTVVDVDDVPRLYRDFYNFLVDSGIDSVKTDVQFMVDTWDDSKARQELLYTYLDTWNRAALQYFNMRTVSCMSMFPQWLFHLQSSSWHPTYPLRSSDDFFPDVPASHPWHIWANSHNCILLQCLNVVPDWDMFQTAHKFAGFHAAARCVSGGPIFITDVPGEHDMEIIRQISGKAPSGKTIIFRPSVIGKAVSPFVGYEDHVLLKVGSYHGASETGTPIMGVFNVSDCPLSELIALSDFPGTVDSVEYVVRAHTTGMVSIPTKLTWPKSLFNVTLGVHDFEILCAFPLTSLPGKESGTVSIANLGLVDKMTGCSAIVKSSMSRRENGRISIDTSLKALGVVGTYISHLPTLSINDDFMITIKGIPIPVHTVTVSGANTHVLEIDIERAWEEMQLGYGQSRYVEIRVDFAA